MIKHQSQPTHLWYMESIPGTNKERIWETNSWGSLCSKYLQVLQDINEDRLTVVDTKEVHLELSSDPTVYVDIKKVNIVNDGAIFHADIEIELPTGVVYGFDETAVDELTLTLEMEGLQNISITPWNGLNCINPTGVPLTGSYTLPKGFLQIIDRVTKFSDYRSNEYRVVLY